MIENNIQTKTTTGAGDRAEFAEAWKEMIEAWISMNEFRAELAAADGCEEPRPGAAEAADGAAGGSPPCSARSA